MKFSILIPVYNSEKSLSSLVDEIEAYFKKSGDDYEILLVDDCSTDESWKQIEVLCLDHHQIKGLRMDQNRGQQMALYWGLKYCEGEFAVTIDDDLQHDIADLDLLLKSAESGADLVFGIYDSYGTNGMRAKGSKLVGMFFKRNYPNLNGNRVSSYRLISRSVYKSIVQSTATFIYLSAELLEFAKVVDNVTIKRRERKFGKSGYTMKKCIEITLKLTFYYGMPLVKRLRKVNVNETCVDGWCGKLSNQWD